MLKGLFNRQRETPGCLLFCLVVPTNLIPLFFAPKRYIEREASINSGPPSWLPPSSPPIFLSATDAVPSNLFYANFVINIRGYSFCRLLRQFLHQHPTVLFPPSSTLILSPTPAAVIYGVFFANFFINPPTFLFDVFSVIPLLLSGIIYLTSTLSHVFS